MRLLAVVMFLALAPAAWGQTPTQVTVRAVSHDAKIIGTQVGGARSVITNAATGQVLAEGVQQGGTGDTAKIITAPVTRGLSIYDTSGAAGFTATLALTVPTLVDITATGPLETPEPATRATKRMLLIPGQNVLGDGIVLELNGFTVKLVSPPATAAAGETFAVRANVTLLCGCPTEPGGTWDASKIDIRARLIQGGRTVAEAPLAYAGTVSTYGGEIRAPAPGAYTLQVTASQAERANFGMAEQAVTVGP